MTGSVEHRAFGNISFPAFSDIEHPPLTGEPEMPPVTGDVPIGPARRCGVMETPPVVGEIPQPVVVGDLETIPARAFGWIDQTGIGDIPITPAIGDIYCGYMETT